MFKGLNGALIGAGLAAIVAFGFGLKFGADGEHRKCEAKITAVRKAAEEVINGNLQEIAVLQVERAQAQAEVAKVNETTLRYFTEMQALLTADQAKRDEAALKVEKAAIDASRNAREAATRAQAAREVIQNAADNCAGAPVSDDLLRMLNGIRTPAP